MPFMKEKRSIIRNKDAIERVGDILRPEIEDQGTPGQRLPYSRIFDELPGPTGKKGRVRPSDAYRSYAKK